MRESTIEKAVCDFAKDNGVKSYKMNGWGNRGKPDRQFLKDGRTIFIELKAPSKKPTALQLRDIRQLRAQKFFADWTDSADVAIGWIKEHLL